MKEENKNIIISFRVTPEEKTWIEEHSYGHYRRISDFVRDCIFKKEIVSIVLEPMKLRTSFRRIGNNLNQLTRAVNAGFVRAVDLWRNQTGGAKSMAIVKFIASGCPINNIFPYVMNRNKTEDGILVSGIHCTPESALDEFRFVKNKFGKTDGQTILPHRPIVQPR